MDKLQFKRVEKHPLSYQYAPSVIEVRFMAGYKTRYENIHYPKKYIAKLLSELTKDDTIKRVSSILVYDKSSNMSHIAYVNPELKRVDTSMDEEDLSNLPF